MGSEAPIRTSNGRLSAVQPQTYPRSIHQPATSSLDPKMLMWLESQTRTEKNILGCVAQIPDVIHASLAQGLQSIRDDIGSMNQRTQTIEQTLAPLADKINTMETTLEVLPTFRKQLGKHESQMKKLSSDSVRQDALLQKILKFLEKNWLPRRVQNLNQAAAVDLRVMPQRNVGNVPQQHTEVHGRRKRYRFGLQDLRKIQDADGGGYKYCCPKCKRFYKANYVMAHIRKHCR